MAHRATKSGIALEAQQKLTSKWEPERSITALHWIGQRIGENITSDGSREDCHRILQDGVVLAKLANWVKKGAVSESKYKKAPTMAFKKMELISLFLQCVDEGNGGPITKCELFQTVDLYESQNLYQVILTIEALGRAMLTCGREGYGKAESKGQQREWTDEQLNAGKGIISLQMGSNKGASQAGQNFGKSRDIMS